MVQQLNVVGDSCESTLVLKRKADILIFEYKLWHFSLSVTQ